MRKFIAILILISSVLTIQAQDSLFLRKSDGTVIGYPKDRVTSVKNDSSSIQINLAYPLDEVNKVSFSQKKEFALTDGKTSYSSSGEESTIKVGFVTSHDCEAAVIGGGSYWCKVSIVEGFLVIHMEANYWGQLRSATIRLMEHNTGKYFDITVKQDFIYSPMSIDYFGLSGDTVDYNSGTVPLPTTTSSLKVSGNSQALPGGSSIFTISYTKTIRYFYIRIDGVNGYYIVRPKSPVVDINEYIYQMTLIFSQKFNKSIIIYISAQTTDGENTTEFPTTINYHQAGTGALQVSLSFSNAKDIDLHVFTPSGEHYYYGHKGGYITENDTTTRFGLDVDSNAGCNIDNINNENITFPESMLETGIYKVYVNMYANCDASIATSWSIVAHWGSSIITNHLGNYGNPVSGLYSVGANSGDMTEVMELYVEKPSSAKHNGIIKITPIPLTDIEKMKMIEEGYLLNL